MAVTTDLTRGALRLTSRVAPSLAVRAALPAFRRPRATARRHPEEEPVMRAARARTLTVDGQDVAVYRWGTGERPVLLLHGWMFRASRFAPLVRALTDRGYSPVAFDAPSHGESPAGEATILQYGATARLLAPADGHYEAVIGHSVGALAGFWAVREEVTATRLIALAPMPGFDFLADSFCAGAGLTGRARTLLRTRIEEEVFPGVPAIWERFSATYRPDRLTLPLLVVHDEDDDMIPVAHARRIAEIYGDRADLLVTRGLGHRRIIRDPHVIDSVLDFVSATDPVHEAHPEG
ncbi:alpha/beta hydrolase [Streptomyces sp. XM4011]|uniref:alpha/beta hydrolase n=1 Tax=Streptomyces sp. XM4011 TaxID=2929780 RepID=UPI001FF7D70E|nr:alpha/beta hydrolase [Streptomyces sp. XM4011]MCK1812855.1 alpha/beta hydrolase [Streptomyces sp. XM4011]